MPPNESEAPMSTREERRKKLREQAEEAAKRTDERLADEMRAVRDLTRPELESLRPKTADPQVYASLIKAVEEATARNESVADFKARVEKLGPAAVDLARQVLKLWKGQ
jgi:hypothetical protein